MAFPLTQGGGAAALFEEFRAVPVGDGASKQDIEAALRELDIRKKDASALRTAAEAGYDWRSISDEVLTVYHSVLSGGSLRIIVCQHGARHRYAIPRMLESEGVLTAFYTDSSGASLLGKCAKFLGSCGVARLQRIRWDVHALPREKVFSSDLYYFHEMLQVLMLSSRKGIRLYQQRHRHLSAKMIKWGLHGANVVYSMYHENLDFIRWAKQQGALSVIDVFVSPLTDEIMAKESRSFGDWNEIDEDPAVSRLEKQLWEEAAEIADILICPSEWVAEGVRSLNPEAAVKIRIVPYGCSLNYGEKTNVPEVGRILFAGREALRKGLHYLASAATQLKMEIPELDVRVAGSMPPEVVDHPICKDLNFIGQLDREQMKQEFLHADAFVLPALSEGFASVVAEALGAGCPVIVTKETGSPVVHEREGLIIPSRDVDALAEAIRRMVSDREFRTRCSENCLAQKPFYSEAQWKARLLEVLNQAVDG
jgi:glycosyltransferase involved in cell wall biosynthesis